MIKTIVKEASRESLNKILDLLEDELVSINCQSEDKVKIFLAFDELFSNIVNYAYKGKETGLVTFKYGLEKNDCFQMIFIDNGVKYNPLEKEDPDVTLSIEDREVGGLGIYLCKKLLDRIEYTYENNQNILYTEKKIERV